MTGALMKIIVDVHKQKRLGRIRYDWVGIDGQVRGLDVDSNAYWDFNAEKEAEQRIKWNIYEELEIRTKINQTMQKMQTIDPSKAEFHYVTFLELERVLNRLNKTIENIELNIKEVTNDG